MRSISDELFYGNNAALRTAGIALTRSMSFQDISQICASLTDEQGEILDKLNDCQTELEGIAEQALFAYAFKLGMRIAFEVFARRNKQEKH